MPTLFVKERSGLTPGTCDWYYRALYTLMFDGAVHWEDDEPKKTECTPEDCSK